MKWGRGDPFIGGTYIATTAAQRLSSRALLVKGVDVGAMVGRITHRMAVDLRRPIMVNMVVNGVLLPMEVGTGAAVSLISWKPWQTRFRRQTG